MRAWYSIGMDILLALMLGWVQGVTEFLPISSTGHLILVREIFPESTVTDGLAFDAVLHLATCAAIILYFSRDIGLLLHTVMRMLGRLPVDDRDKTLVYALGLGTIPAVVAGVFLERLMDTLFRSPLLVAGVLILGSLIFAYAEYVFAYKNDRAPLTTKMGWRIGLFQMLALIPGMSRSGITISGGLILGLSRTEATRFAFLLAVPVMLGAGAKKMLELITKPESVEWMVVGAGATSAFVVGLFAIHFMVRFMRSNSLWPFIWYRILLAIFVIALVFFG